MPLWNPYTNFGFPQMGDPGTWYPISYLFASVSPYGLYQLHAEFIFHGWLAGAGMYVLNRSLGHGKQGALIAALAYQWSGFFIGNAQHLGWLVSAAWLPWVIWCFRAVRFQQFKGATLLLPVLLYFQLTGGYPGMFIISTYLLVLIGMYYSIGLLVRQEWSSLWKWILRLVIAAIVFVGCSAIVLSSSMEFSQYLVRGSGLQYHNGDWGLLNGSFPLKGLITLFFPFAASLNDNKFWGEDFSMINIYMGLLPFIIAFWQGIRPGAPRSHRLLWVVGMLAVGVAMAHVFPFRRWLYEWVPGMDQFRFPSIFRSVFLFAFALLSGAGFEKLMEVSSVKRKWLLTTIGVLLAFTAGIYLLVYCVGNQSWDWNKSTITDRIFFHGILQGTSFLILAGIAWWRPKFWRTGLLLVVIGDLWMSVQLNQWSTALSNVPGHRTQTVLSQLTGLPPFPILHLPMGLIQESSMSGAIPELYANQGTLLRIPGSDGSCPYILKSTIEAQSKGHWDKMLHNPLLSAPRDTNFYVRPIAATASSFRFEVDKKNAGQVVFAQHQYPWWKALLNGKPIAIQTYLTAWMSVEIPAGKHQLEFVFEPDRWFLMLWVSIVTLLLITVILCWKFLFPILSRKQKISILIAVFIWSIAAMVHWWSIRTNDQQIIAFSKDLPSSTCQNIPRPIGEEKKHWTPARILPEIPELVRSIDSGKEKILLEWGQPKFLLFEEVMSAYYPFKNTKSFKKGGIHHWSLDSMAGMQRMTYSLAVEHFEGEFSPWLGLNMRDSGFAYQGRYSQPVAAAGYSAGFKIPCNKIHGSLENVTLLYGAKVKGLVDEGTQCVIEIKRNGQTIHWFGQPVKTVFSHPDQLGWWHGLLQIKLPEDVQENDEIVAYVWNNSPVKVWVDHCVLSQIKSGK